MGEIKEWFTLPEVAELWRPVDASGVPLAGTAAIDAVLKLAYVSVTGVRLQVSYNLSASIQAERFVWGKTGSRRMKKRAVVGVDGQVVSDAEYVDDKRGRWQPFDLSGMVNIRFCRDHISSDDGFIWIHADDGCDGVSNELLVLPAEPKLKIRVACQHNTVAEDECFSDSVVKLDEAGLLVSREALTEYARKRGRDDVLKRLDGQEAVLLAPVGEEVEQVKGGKPETGMGLIVPSREKRIAVFTEQALDLLQKKTPRREIAEVLKRDGATNEMIGMILTNDERSEELV